MSRAITSSYLLLALLGLATAEFTGLGTAYSGPGDKDATGFNACQFGKLEERWERFYGAMNSAQYPGTCGKCVRVRGTAAGASGKSFLVKLVDECPTCSYGDVDFSTVALQAITGFSWDRKAIAWEFADCSGPSDAKSERREVEEPQPKREDEEARQQEEDDKPKQEAHGEAKPKGTYSTWVVDCDSGRKRCTNLGLASQGYQCMNKDETRCCLKHNGKQCKDVDSVDEEGVEWEGGNGRRNKALLRKLLRH